MPRVKVKINAEYGDVVIASNYEIERDAPLSFSTAVAAGKAVTAWNQSDANTAACNLPGGHGYTTGVFDVYWTSGGGGRRYGVAGTVTVNALTLDGGTGDDFPADNDATVIVCRQEERTFTINGDELALLIANLEATGGSAAGKRGHITFVDADDAVVYELDLTANRARKWDIDGGDSNDFEGAVVAGFTVSGEIAFTLKFVGAQDATPA